MKQKVIFIAGATGSGKSDLAIFLAKKINGEIINADSRQIYKNLDTGSGKISICADRRGHQRGLTQKNILYSEKFNIPHHLLSIASPKMNFSLGRWLELSDRAIKEITRKGAVPIFCGGTNLYLKAFKEGWVLPNIKPDYKLRKKLEQLSVEKLFEMLKKIDPERAESIESKNKRRLIRAIEITNIIGKVPKLKKKPQYDVLVIAIDIPFSKLQAKIKKRFYERFPGIVKEIKKLRKLGLSFKRIMSFGLSYFWLGKYMKGEISIQDAKEKSCQSEINFAKRQIKELKKLLYVVWIKNKKQALNSCKEFLV